MGQGRKLYEATGSPHFNTRAVYATPNHSSRDVPWQVWHSLGLSMPSLWIIVHLVNINCHWVL